MLDKNHRAMVRMFLYHQFMVRSDTGDKYHENPSRSDIVAIKYGLPYSIEFKFGNDGSFDMRNWRPEQRAWALKYSISAPWCVPYWVLLSVSPKHVSGKHISDRVHTPSWLVPAKIFNDLHQYTIDRYGIHTIQLKVSKHHNIMMQEDNFDFENQLYAYRLNWHPPETMFYPDTFENKAGQPYKTCLYTIPTDHPFFCQEEYHERRTKIEAGSARI